VNLNNLVVGVVGAGGLLGRAFAGAIVDAGGTIVVGDIDEERVQNLCNEISVERCHPCVVDVRQLRSINEFIEEGVRAYGKIDAIVQAAYPRSAAWGTPFGSLTEGHLTEDLFGQLGGAILVSQEAVKYFSKVGSGNLVHISSIYGTSTPKFEQYDGTSITCPIEYSAMKAGIVSLTRYVAKFCKGKNIRVNCISPGGILDNQPEVFRKNYKQYCLSKGMLDARDVCGTLLFLLSESSRYISGQNIVVDDGWSL
jgi:NAD(P)-dependent dehydrogenase (short-subunit alcohol dehydrogenase family)